MSNTASENVKWGEGTIESVRPETIDYDERLPEAAATRLAALRRAKDEVSVLVRSFSEQYMEARQDFHRAQQQLSQITEPQMGQTRNVLPDDDPRVIAARKRFEAKRKIAEDMTQRRDEFSERFHELGGLLRRVEGWLSEQSGEIAAYTGKLPGTRKGEDPEAAVARLRDERAELADELHNVRAAPKTGEELKRTALAELEDLASRGAPQIDGGGSLAWPKVSISSTVSAFAATGDQPAGVGGLAHALVPDAFALTAWLNKDALATRIGQLIDDEADEGALSADERQKREHDLLAQILDAERAECALIAASRVPIAYRSDTDPRAFLACEGRMPRDPWS